MKKRPAKVPAKALAKPAKNARRATGKLQVLLPTLSNNLSLYVKGGVAKATLRPRESNGKLLNEVSKELARPGVKHKSVFTLAGVSSYSVSPDNPEFFIRESASGHKIVGRLVNGQFRPLKQTAKLASAK